ncbi:hypothetical protein SEA_DANIELLEIGNACE_54 [Arthrobacter phage DanielleIgnace]|nr:hypothetical protein SEA_DANIELLEIGNACE_54 [Arthrobacter phage DanielleIgnace]
MTEQQYPAPQPAGSTYAGWMPPQPPKKKLSSGKVIIGAVALVAAFGIGAGAGASGSKAPAAAPAPAPTVTVTAPPQISTVEKTPAACLTYIDLSEQAFSYSGEAMSYMSDAMGAASKLQVSGITAANEKLNILNPKLKALTAPLNTAKASCKAKG